MWAKQQKKRSRFTRQQKDGECDGNDERRDKKMGVRDTNTRDTYSSLKIESNYRQGAKRKDEKRRGGNEERGSDGRKCVVEEAAQARGAKGRCKRILGN